MITPKWRALHRRVGMLGLLALILAMPCSHAAIAQTSTPTPAATIDLIATATAQASELLTSIAETQVATPNAAERVATAIAATLTALAALAPPPSPTLPATSTPIPLATATPAPATALCTVLVSSLNLRSGPGVNYTPPIGALLQNAVLTPLARNAAATWLQVVVDSTGRTGWISAGTQYVRCTLAVDQLPIAQTPPTPTPNPLRPTATPAYTQVAPPGTPASVASGDRWVTLREPENNANGNRRWNFRWEPNFALPAGTAFEVVFWQDGQDPLTQSKGGVPPTQNNQAGITLDVLYGLGIVRSGRNHWGVLLVQPESGSQPYRRLAFLRGDFIFNYSPVPPTPTPTDTPTPKPKK